ncbi:VOC family protein [Cytophagaceae bacterium DM2B3-1]|uniref:VOC family protein n=1 Tax=Xanthocytophaga flava TaxID=3048013 RepID=A0ABT7CU59_9BACT|nr:VOC family protein [Xanthocytophaga flavus]MDJ1497308.1 VOC family protein [Xanthocytophaga flavus]
MYPTAFSFFIATLLFITTSSHTLPYTSSLVIGTDHIPLAVRDLDQAATFYRSIGFALKPGRSHSNGIRNQHIKFRNGTELELITTSQPHDSVTAEYCRLLKEGEGPAFWGLFTKDTEGIAKQLTAIGQEYQREGPMITFSETDRLHTLFLGGRNHSPTDREEHFQHTNSATNLIGVYL